MFDPCTEVWQVEVQQDGVALIELEPTTSSGYVMLHLRYNERQEEEFKVWLEPAARDWIWPHS